MAYYNIDSADGNELTAGVSEHEIAAMAQRMANERGEAVYYYQGGTDGEDEIESTEVLPEGERIPPADCWACKGTGAIPLRGWRDGMTLETCATCKGTGEVRSEVAS